MNAFFKQRHRLRTLVAVVTAAGIGVATASCAGHSAAHTAAGLPAAASSVSSTGAGISSGTSSGTSTGAGTGAVTTPGGPSASTAGPAPSSTTAGPKAPTTSATAGSSGPSSQPGPVGPPNQPAPPVPPPVSASNLPNAAKVSWRPMGGLVAMTVPPAHDIGIGECAKVHGAVAWHEQGYVSAQNTPAQEDIFGFGDAASAAQQFSAIAAGLNACTQTTRDLQRTAGVPQDAVVTTTATAVRAQAWSRRWTGFAGQSAAGPQTNHYYLVQRGPTVILASFTEFGASPPNPYDPVGDPAVLTMLSASVAS